MKAMIYMLSNSDNEDLLMDFSALLETVLLENHIYSFVCSIKITFTATNSILPEAAFWQEAKRRSRRGRAGLKEGAVGLNTIAYGDIPSVWRRATSKWCTQDMTTSLLKNLCLSKIFSSKHRSFNSLKRKS